MSHRNGCFNRKPFLKSFKGSDGHLPEGSPGVPPGGRVRKEVIIPFVMSRGCMHDKKQTDPSCEGCVWVYGMPPEEEGQ